MENNSLKIYINKRIKIGKVIAVVIKNSTNINIIIMLVMVVNIFIIEIKINLR
jgi:hypothetical protein